MDILESISGSAGGGPSQELQKELSRIVENAEREPSDRVAKVLDVVARFGDRMDAPSILRSLLRHPDLRIQSRAAILLGRFHADAGWVCHWVRSHMKTADPRFRANAVEALWETSSPAALPVYTLALADDHPRVVANALVGLILLGDPGSVGKLQAMASDERPEFRASAAFAMGQTAAPEFLPNLAKAVKDEDPRVRTRAVHAIVALRKAQHERANRKKAEPAREGTPVGAQVA